MIEYIPIISLLIAMAIILPFAIWLEKRGRDKKRSLIVPDQRRWFGLFLALFLIAGCDNHSTEPDTISGAESSKISFPAFPNFPALPAPPGGTVTVTTPATTTTSTAPVSSGKETGSYHGAYNGNRVTFYFSKKMSGYPAQFRLTISGCVSQKTINNNGSRFEGSNGLVVKQSEVSGRGMAVVGPYGCTSTSAYVEW